MSEMVEKLSLKLFIVFGKGFEKNLNLQQILERIEAKKTSFFWKFSDIFANIFQVSIGNRSKPSLNTVRNIYTCIEPL